MHVLGFPLWYRCYVIHGKTIRLFFIVITCVRWADRICVNNDK